jgi:hypothetical protein
MWLIGRFMVTNCAQHSVPPSAGTGRAGGTLRVLKPFEWLEVGSVKVALSCPWRETLKSACFLVFPATFWQFLSLLWEIVMNIFRSRGFSTVSLGG